jgi:chromosome segregation ATPase
MVMGMQSGATVGQTLQQAVERVRRQLDEHVGGLQALDRHVNDLVERRGGTLLELSRHYLPDLRIETVQATFVEVRNDLLEVLSRKQKRERELHDQSAAAEREAEHLEAELARVTEALNGKVAEREKLEQVVSERLHGSDEFKTLAEQAIAAETELEKNEDRVGEMTAEAEKKLPSYERSRLFKYLYEAEYGTPLYKGKGLTRRIDGWVAKMIDFAAARRGYDFLRVTPELMAQEVTRRREAFNDLMQQVEAIEDRVSDEVGLTDVLREGQVLGAERDGAVAAVGKAENELLSRQKELAALSRPENEFHTQALARMQSFLASLSPADLANKSARTPERDDDAIVAEVTYLSEQLTDADRQQSQLAGERRSWEERLGGLQSVVQRFRQAEFDSRRSVFEASLDADALVSAYVAGRIGAAELWSNFERNQRLLPEWHEQPGRGGIDFGHVNVGGDVSQVLLRVLIEGASAAMRHSAQRGMQRRSMPRSAQRQSSGRPPFPNRGFTNGRGF